MPESSVLVTYSAPQAFLSSQWPEFRDSLQSQLPLRSIHWKPPSGPSIRTIQELSIDFVAFDSAREAGTSQIPSNILAKPLLNIYLVSCEDAESYKSTVRKQIKDWHALAIQRKNQEWVIIHLVRSDSKNPAAGFFQRGNILDKLRADFNTDKRDRCVQLVWPVSQTNPTAWAEVLSKIKDGTLSSFDAAICQREDEVRRSEQQRLMPGWNFCTFFLLKESLALSYESMSLIDDAFRQYDQLEASFLHVVREKNLSWFGALIVPAPRDDSTPLLSVTRKSYQDLILANTISVFDLQIYMLARQAALLAKSGKLADICLKVHKLLVSFGRQLWDVENTLPAYFIESWTYSSALSTVDQIDAWAQDPNVEVLSLSLLNASKAELYELARHQLDTLGISIGHLPARSPFALAISSSRPKLKATDKRASRAISQPQLIACLNDEDAFYDLYISLSNKAIDLYAKAGRRKFALKVHGSLAALDLHRGNLDPALRIYSSLPAHYSPHKWASLESFMLTQAIDLHATTSDPATPQQISLILSFLRAYVDSHGQDLLIPKDDIPAYITAMIVTLKSLADRLSSDIEQLDHPMLSTRLSDGTARREEEDDGCYLDVEVENHLPCRVLVDDIRISLAGMESQQLEFRASTEFLEPGATTVTLFCPTSSWGTYIHNKTHIHLARLHFQWDHNPSSRNKPRAPKVPTLVRLPHDIHTLDIKVRRPRLIVLGAPPSILVTVASGRKDIARLAIKLNSPSGIEFQYQDTRLEDDGSEQPFEATDNSITLTNIAKDSVVPILIPYSDAPHLTSIQVHLSVTYTTSLQRAIERSLTLVSRIPAVLPVRVNVEDFFRGSRLFSSFTISTTSTQYIRIASVDLHAASEQGSDLSIRKTNPRDLNIITVMPGRPITVPFTLEANKSLEVDSLVLRIRYRMLRDEVETLLEETIDSVIPDEATLKKHRATLLAGLVEALESDPAWVEVYTTTGELHAPTMPNHAEAGDLLITINEALRRLKPIGVDHGSWRELRMPVDLPLRNVLAAAHLSIIPSQYPMETASRRPQLTVYAGQPVPALVTIHTKFDWGRPSHITHQAYRLRFEIDELVRDWLVSGRKRGDFEAKDDGTYTTRITLIPLHHGELPLPKITVTPLPLTGEMTMGSLSLPSCETHQVHGAEVVLVLPRGGRSTFVVDMGEGVS